MPFAAEPAVPLPTKEEIDVARHREITSKAVSAILVLVLKWFKASRKSEHRLIPRILLTRVRYTQISLCRPAPLRFELPAPCAQDVWTFRRLSVRHGQKRVGRRQVGATSYTTMSADEGSFFRYCYLHCAPNPDKSTLDANRSSFPKPPTTVTVNGEELEVCSEYSWRNFFTSINFLKILQKMTKHRSHRTCMLNQYKSSVSPIL